MNRLRLRLITSRGLTTPPRRIETSKRVFQGFFLRLRRKPVRGVIDYARANNGPNSSHHNGVLCVEMTLTKATTLANKNNCTNCVEINQQCRLRLRTNFRTGNEAPRKKSKRKHNPDPPLPLGLWGSDEPIQVEEHHAKRGQSGDRYERYELCGNHPVNRL